MTDGRDTVNYNFKHFLNSNENNNSKKLENLLKNTKWMK